jgi:hypothetical protein
MRMSNMMKPNRDDVVDWLYTQPDEFVFSFIRLRMADTLREMLTNTVVDQGPEVALSETMTDLLFSAWETEYEIEQMRLEAEPEGDELILDAPVTMTDRDRRAI